MNAVQFSIVATIAIIIAVICTGCMTPDPSPPATVSIPSERPPLVPATSRTQTGSTAPAKNDPYPVPDAPFITIDPISDKNTGDLVIISGTTNLPPGSSIYLKDVNESTGELTMRANNIACPDTHGVNRWRFVFDSTAWMRPGKYQYLVSTPKGNVNNSVKFNLNGAFTGPEKILYYRGGTKSATIPGTGSYPSIIVDPIGDRHKGEIIRITGTTNLVEGTLLQCTVWPVYFDDRLKGPAIKSEDPCDGQFNIAGSPTAVVKGTGDTNRWSCPADLTIFPEKTGMNIHVSTTDEFFTVREIYGNATFNLS